jgi:hypothetical protein
VKEVGVERLLKVSKQVLLALASEGVDISRGRDGDSAGRELEIVISPFLRNLDLLRGPI